LSYGGLLSTRNFKKSLFPPGMIDVMSPLSQPYTL